MKKFFMIAGLCGLLLSLFVQPSSAQQRTVTIKLASLAPESTPWGAALNKMAADCSAATNGEVKFIIYHNGVAGMESDVLRKLKMNQIQAAVFTSSGMNLITSDIITLSCPFLIRTDEELDAVLDKLRPRLERSVNNAGFIPLAWSKVGWISFFSRRPVFTPADIKRQKLAVGRDTDAITDVFKTMGYQLVETSLNDVLVSLNSGAIDAAYQSPVNAAASQIFGIAKNMSFLRIAPFMGAILMNQSAWRSIPEKHRETVRRIGRQTEAANNRNVQKMEEDAVAAMLKYGLVVNDCTAEQEAEWAADINRVMPELLDKTFNKELYNEIVDVLKAARSGQ